MNLEAILLFADYFRLLSKKNWITEVILPFIISAITITVVLISNHVLPFSAFASNAVSLLGILVGFSITCVIFLVTASGDNVKALKETDAKKNIGLKNLNLFDLLIINFSYSLIVEVFILIANLISPLLLGGLGLTYQAKSILIGLDLFFILHALFLTIRNISELYHLLLWDGNR